MKVHLKFFSIYRDRFKRYEDDVELHSPFTARQIFIQTLNDQGLAERMLRFTRFAVNGEYAPPETVLKDGDELAFIPPVSGG